MTEEQVFLAVSIWPTRPTDRLSGQGLRQGRGLRRQVESCLPPTSRRLSSWMSRSASSSKPARRLRATTTPPFCTPTWEAMPWTTRKNRTRNPTICTSCSRPPGPIRWAGWAITKCWRCSAGAASASSCGPSTRCCSAWSPSRCWPRQLAATSPARKRFLREARASAAGSPRERRADPCRRGTAAALPGHGVHPRRDPAAAARPHRAAGGGGDACASAGRSPRAWPRPTPPG